MYSDKALNALRRLVEQRVILHLPLSDAKVHIIQLHEDYSKVEALTHWTNKLVFLLYSTTSTSASTTSTSASTSPNITPFLQLLLC